MIEAIQTLSGNVSTTQTLSGTARETGIQGLSAYEVYKKNGGTLSEEEWLESLQGSNGVMVLAEDDDATKIEKLMSVIEDGIAVRPLFYRGRGGENEIAGIYQLFQSYTDNKGRTFILVCYLDAVFAIRFTVSSDNTLTKIAINASWLDFTGIKQITGELESLSTEDKTSLVNAINEVASNGGGTGGTTDYNSLENKPSINNVELSGNKTLDELGIQPSGDYLTEEELQSKGFLTNESDPTVPNHVKNITEEDITNWNNKSDFDGSYNSLTNTPTIPTKISELENDIPYATESFVTNKIAEAELSGSDVDLSGLATKDELATKVDKVTGKSLISDTEIERLANVTNYDDTELKEQINSKATISDMTNYIEEHKEELKGVDGQDGYTPVKGIDYFDGQDGTNGVDGFSPTATVTETSTGATITITDKNGTTTTNITNGKDGVDGSKGDKGDTGATGEKGTDGISATHSWNGTTLTITSASGTSSADLKGEKGDTGATGEKGDKGDKGDTGATGGAGKDGSDGVSPIITTSKTGKVTTLTITDANGEKTITINDGLDGTDGADGKDGTDGADGTTQLVPNFANDTNECTDTSKLYVLPDGNIYAYMTKETHTEAPELFDRDACTLNARYSGTPGSETTKNGYYITDFIPVDMSLSDPIILRFKGGKMWTSTASSSGDKLILFDANKKTLATTYFYELFNNQSVVGHYVETDGDDYIVKLGYTCTPSVSTVLEKHANYNEIAYIRINQCINSSATALTIDFVPDVSITIDAMGGTKTETGWMNTGHAFVPADYEERIVVLEEQNNTHDAELYKLDNRVKSIEDGTTAINVPEYWQEAVDGVVTKVKALQDEGGSDVVNFMWFSDMHHNPDNKYTANIGSLCASVMNECNIPLTLMTGDTMSADSVSSEEILLSWIESAKKVLSPIGADRLMQIRGNHDDVYGTATVDGTTKYYVNKVAPEKIWNRMHREQAQDFHRVFGDDGTYFYIDNNPQKIRFICLNTHFYEGEEIKDGTTGAMTSGFGEKQLAWLENTALAVENGWYVVIATHIPPTAQSVNGNTYYLSQLSDGTNFRNIIMNTTTNIIGIFCGHCHADAIVTNDLPCPIMTITCAINTPYDGTASQRVAGTTTETAIDVVSINKKTKMIYTTRLGIGADRVINY